MEVKLRKRYPGFCLDMKFHMEPHGRLAVLGPSGSGKTTLLNLLAGVEQGELCEVTPRPARVGYVFQELALFPNMTVAQNIAAGLGKGVRPSDSRVEEIMKRCRLRGLEGRYPAQLSGGEKQRTALARALVYEPELLLLDEPFSSLNRELKLSLWEELEELLKDYDGDVILVTHEEEEARRFGKKLLLLEGGKILRQGPEWRTLLSGGEEDGIYADFAATCVHKPFEVIRSVEEELRYGGNAGRGAHEAALGASRRIYETRLLLTELFDAEGPEQTVFTANVTESLNLLIKGILEPGDRVITTLAEHNSVLRPLYEMEEKGVRLEFLPCEADGSVSVEGLRAALKEPARMFICTHASNVTGNVNDIHVMGELCRRAGCLFLLDAAQTAGVFPISMKRDHIDAVCFTGHKGLLGPQGTGGCCLRRGLAVKTWKSGGSGLKSFERRQPQELPEALEAGTLNGPGIAGLRAGLSFIRRVGMAVIRERELALARQFYTGVRGIPGVTVYGSFESCERAPVVALNVRDYDSSAVSEALERRYRILTRPGIHCAPLMHRHFGTQQRGMVRFSFSYTNTEEEITRILTAVSEIAAGE